MYRWIAVIVIGFSYTATAAWADTAEQLFEQLFGEAARRAAASSDTADDADLAEKMYQAADNLKNSAEHRDFKLLLYERAFEFGMKDAVSIETADRAVGRLMRYDKDNRTAWLRKQVEAYYQAYLRSPREDKPERGDAAIDMAVSAGDRLMNAEDYTTAMDVYKRASAVATQLRSPRREEVQALIRGAGQRVLQKRKLDMLLKRFEGKPTDKIVAKQLVNTYVIDFDKPTEAVKYAEVSGDVPAIEALKIVTSRSNDVSADDAIKAAEWYEDMVKSAPKDSQNNLRQRALGFYELFLDKKKSASVETMKAQLKVEQLTAAISGEDEATGTGGSSGHTTTVDVLKLIDIEKHGSDRDWMEKDGVVASLGNRYGNELVAPVKVTGSYQITLRLKLPPLSTEYYEPDVYVMLPFGEKDQTYFFISGDGWAEPRLGVSRQPRRIPAFLQPNRTHTIVVRVEVRGDKAQVQAAIDGKKILTWSGLQQEADVYEYYQIGKVSNPGIRINDGHLAIVKYQIKPLGSDSKVEKDLDARP